MKISAVYKIQSKIKPERFYIGSGKNIRSRWSEHLNDLKKNQHHSVKLQRHYNKYGKDDLVFMIIEPCLPEFLLVREDAYFNPLPYFNIAKFAASPFKGRKHKPESIAKFVAKNTGKKRTPEQNKEQSERKKGVVFSEVHRKHISESKKGKASIFKGKHHSEESKQIIRDSKLGKPSPMKGKRYSDDSRKNMGRKKGSIPWNKNREGCFSEKTLKQMSISHKGAIVSETTKEKQSIAHKGMHSGSKNPMFGKIPWNKGLKKELLNANMN